MVEAGSSAEGVMEEPPAGFCLTLGNARSKAQELASKIIVVEPCESALKYEDMDTVKENGIVWWSSIVRFSYDDQTVIAESGHFFPGGPKSTPPGI